MVTGVMVVFAMVFSRQMQVVQGQGELAAVKSTLGALRTALVIDYVHRNVILGKSTVAVRRRNPFELLERYPVNYGGEMTFEQAQAAPAGSWVFDPVCDCVGYVPIYAQWFDSPRGDVMAWYEVSGTAGPLQLTPKQTYVWQGQVMN